MCTRYVQVGSEVGGSESARTERPNWEVVPSCPCMRVRSVIHVESGMKCRVGLLPFSLLAVRVSLFRSGFINLV